MTYLKFNGYYINAEHISAIYIGEDDFYKGKVECEIHYTGNATTMTFNDLISNDEINENLCYLILGIIDKLKGEGNNATLGVIDLEDIIYDTYRNPEGLSIAVDKARFRKDA